MKEYFDEDVLIDPSGLQGPAIRLDYQRRTFSVKFPNSMEFFRSSRNDLKIIHARYKTVGQANIGQMHDRLDEFLNLLLKEGQ